MGEILSNYLNSFSILGLALTITITLYFLAKGADQLVDGAVAISMEWGVPKVIIGATIISLGTTLPEASVSIMAAIQGNPHLALGNAVGSIIADTGLIIGLATLMGHLPVDPFLVQRQGRLQLGSGLLLVLVSLPILSTKPGGNISQLVGIGFLGLLLLYIIFSIRWSRNSNLANFQEEGILATDQGRGFSAFPRLILGIVLVIGSSVVLIPTVEITALRLGIPQSVIAATLVALGTSLPELVMSITSVRRGHGELALGNIIGADILNVLFVTGGAAAVTREGLAVPSNYYFLQFPAMIIVLVLFRLFTSGGRGAITRVQGLILLSAYIIYIGLNYL